MQLTKTDNNGLVLTLSNYAAWALFRRLSGDAPCSETEAGFVAQAVSEIGEALEAYPHSGHELTDEADEAISDQIREQPPDKKGAAGEGL